MKNNETTVGIVAGNVTETTKSICRSLAEKGISAIVMQKEIRKPEVVETAAGEDQHNWSGQPGKDLFFNGWKLLF
ncbi:hypothetical protein GO755_36680 [Spirosoma sp. HMF4905]|uniref:Uncharacterized protein n=1 Tax=Spirosoma arboris TaxID=2682092 RepID=A0A7K1SP99_9BACT|nr:hypothetical protein [Spirosoma arboris]MVM35611.1 hypothetical protein [Spirosoma arboris]